MWVVVGWTFGRIYCATNREEAWRRFRTASEWVACRCGALDTQIAVTPEAKGLIESGRPAVYVVNHCPVPLLDTVWIPLIGLRRCKIVAGCVGAPGIGGVYDRLDSIRVLAGGGNIPRVLEEAHRAMKQGYSVVVMGGGGPHGATRTRWDRLMGLQLGAFLIAVQEHCPVVPVVLRDPLSAYGILHPKSALALALPSMRHRLTIDVGEPLEPADFADSPQLLRDATLASINHALSI
jgi:1-acyl-sn-glycerol-3-phosphate acyltransferase